ncbi:MAG: A/G-specific adenine glycosylase [Patescibacteria group bacterium]
MPWRPRTGERLSPYHVVVSEIMLQQTQVSRVEKKFPPFIKKFPNFKALRDAHLKDVLKEWKGLGYNRRALNLYRLAGDIESRLPKTYRELLELPGIGANTAGSILAFAHNIPHPFIETNIRAVYIHFFFKDKKKVHDKELMPLIEKTLDKKNPREWYYALMDYGTHLKKKGENPSRKSTHHIKQSKFKGSNRELRAQILQMIVESPSTMEKVQKRLTDASEHNIEKNLLDLVYEGFLEKRNTIYSVRK